MASKSNTLIGKILGNCTLEKIIGQGGMGAVYLAGQTRPSRYVAVKVLFPRGVIDHRAYNEFLIRFRREADVIARLEHITIMPIYEYGEQDGFADTIHDALAFGTITPLPDSTVQVALTLTASETTGTSIFQGYYVVGVENGNLRLMDAHFNKVG